MSRSFSNAEKELIREKLIAECRISWQTIGYRNTKIDALCTKAGISKGAFYAFFESKEHLFCRILDIEQEEELALQETLPPLPAKEDIGRLLKEIYLSYDRNNILTKRNDVDFISFLNRAPREWVAASQQTSVDFINRNIFHPNLTLKMSKEKTLGIFNALLAILTSKEILGYDHYEVFCTLLDSVLNEIYE